MYHLIQNKKANDIVNTSFLGITYQSIMKLADEENRGKLNSQNLKGSLGMHIYCIPKTVYAGSKSMQHVSTTYTVQ